MTDTNMASAAPDRHEHYFPLPEELGCDPDAVGWERGMCACGARYDEGDIELPDPALVRELAGRVREHYGRSLTGKATFADILAASDADGGWPKLQGLGDGDLELLLDDIQTEIG